MTCSTNPISSFNVLAAYFRAQPPLALRLTAASITALFRDREGFSLTMRYQDVLVECMVIRASRVSVCSATACLLTVHTASFLSSKRPMSLHDLVTLLTSSHCDRYSTTVWTTSPSMPVRRFFVVGLAVTSFDDEVLARFVHGSPPCWVAWRLIPWVAPLLLFVICICVCVWVVLQILALYNDLLLCLEWKSGRSFFLCLNWWLEGFSRAPMRCSEPAKSCHDHMTVI